MNTIIMDVDHLLGKHSSIWISLLSSSQQMEYNGPHAKGEM